MHVDNVGSQGRLCHIIDGADEIADRRRRQIADRWRAIIPGTIDIRQQESEQADECGNKM